jgi:hypothetical protein
MNRDEAVICAFSEFYQTMQNALNAVMATVDARARAEEREAVAAWIMSKGFATGHGDTTADLLNHLEWQIVEREREACAVLAENGLLGITIAQAIRARGEIYD